MPGSLLACTAYIYLYRLTGCIPYHASSSHPQAQDGMAKPGPGEAYLKYWAHPFPLQL